MTNGQSLSDYKYVVYGQEVEGGSMKMTDVMFSVQNEIAKVLKEVSKQDALNISMNGERILSPRVNVNSELWDGGPILNKPSAR